MHEFAMLMLGVVLGVAGSEVYSVVKTRILSAREHRFSKGFEQSEDAPRHAENIRQIFAGGHRDEVLYCTAELGNGTILPIIHDPMDRLNGMILPESDSPLRVVDADRRTFDFDSSIIERMKRAGLDLWDGPILYALGRGAVEGELPVGVCGYFAHVALAERVLRESDDIAGDKPILLGSLTSFDQALSGSAAPIVVSGATTCVFETAGERVTAIQRRSRRVVNDRGLSGVMPLFGIEPNFFGKERSRFGVLTYNLLKEFLEEFFGQEELVRAGDHPEAAHPDWVFRTPEGEGIVAELEAGRLEIACTGAAVDLADGSLALAILAHFTSTEYLNELKLGARGNWESSVDDGPRIEFIPLLDPRLDAAASAGCFTSTSVFSLDRARSYFGRRAPGQVSAKT